MYSKEKVLKGTNSLIILFLTVYVSTSKYDLIYGVKTFFIIESLSGILFHKLFTFIYQEQALGYLLLKVDCFGVD